MRLLGLFQMASFPTTRTNDVGTFREKPIIVFNLQQQIQVVQNVPWDTLTNINYFAH